MSSSLPRADRELRARMLVAWLLILAMPFALVYTFLFVVNTLTAASIWIHPAIVAVIVIAVLALQYRFGPSLVVASVDATREDGVESDHGAIEETLTRLSSQIDIPTPRLTIYRGAMPNAFAVGTPGHGHIVVTTGLLELLEDDEIEAVLAHELAHLKNRDASVMTVAWVIPTITYVISVFAANVIASLGSAIAPSKPRSSQPQSGAAHYHEVRQGTAHGSAGGGEFPLFRIPAIIVIGLSALITLTISAVFWLASVALYRVLAQYREFAADRGAVAITGSPTALVSALRKIDGDMANVPDTDLRQFDGGAEALYFAPLDPGVFEGRRMVSRDLFPATHPATDERIERIQAIASD